METASITPSDGSATATSSALPALTTPIVQQDDCANIWHLTSLVSEDSSYYYRSSGTRSRGTRTFTSTITLLESTAAGTQFASCQPSGWSPGFSFSPAVCPSGWTYYNMEATGTIVSGYRSIHSAATCCASGFQPQRLSSPVLATITEPCYREIETETRIVDNDGTTHLISRAIQVHHPWHVSWKESETDGLSLSLPALTSSMRVPSWVPGQSIPPGAYDGSSSGNSTNLRGMEGVVWFLITGVPMISVALIGSCVWCCVHHRRVKRREKLRALQEQVRRAYEAVPGVPPAAPG